MKDPLKPRDKITQKMSHDGLIEVNETKETAERISRREQETDFSKQPEQAAQDTAAQLTSPGTFPKNDTGKTERVMEHIGAAQTRQASKNAVRRAQEEAAANVKTSRLQFTAEELSNPELEAYIRKSQKAADNLDAARAALPKEKVIVKERVFDEAKGKAKIRATILIKGKKKATLTCNIKVKKAAKTSVAKTSTPKSSTNPVVSALPSVAPTTVTPTTAPTASSIPTPTKIPAPTRTPRPTDFLSNSQLPNLQPDTYETYAQTIKADGENNPITTNGYVADPTAISYNGRMYVYLTNDQQNYELGRVTMIIRTLCQFVSFPLLIW